jgi:hypothetical protein
MIAGDVQNIQGLLVAGVEEPSPRYGPGLSWVKIGAVVKMGCRVT